MTPMLIRVAAAQIALGKASYREAVDDAAFLIREASKLGAQIVCLPEHWLLEHREQGYDAIEVLAEVALAERIFVITGANYFPVSREELRIRSFLIGPDGKILGSQDKVHLFRAEKRLARPGNGYEVIQTVLGGIGIVVCYDNVFPEACRTLVLKGADVLFVPSRIISEGIDPWILYLRTRALENRIPVVAPNVFHPPRYLGCSVIIDLDLDEASGVVLPKPIVAAKTGQTVIVAEIDVDRASRLRKERLGDRRPSAYVGLQT